MIHFHTDPFPASIGTLPFCSNSSNQCFVLFTILKWEGCRNFCKIYVWIQIILKFAVYLGLKNKIGEFKKAFEQEFFVQKCKSFEFMLLGGFLIRERSNVYIKAGSFSPFSLSILKIPVIVLTFLELNSESVQFSMQNSLFIKGNNM